MRLRITRNAAEEKLILLLNEGYKLKDRISQDYTQKIHAGTFAEDHDIPQYRAAVQSWVANVQAGLQAIFPTSLESSFFVTSKSFANISVPGINQHFSALIHQILPNYLDRLKSIVDSDLQRYTNLPVEDRLYVEHIDSFQKVRDINPGMVTSFLKNGFLDQSEDQVQLALEQILDVSFHKKDWGGEFNDLYTANVVVNGARHATAFLLKGPGIGKKTMEIADCGKNGDQIVRLFGTPADLFVVQYVGPISEMLVRDVQGKVAELRAQGKASNFLVMDGQDTARLLHAYGKLE